MQPECMWQDLAVHVHVTYIVNDKLKFNIFMGNRSYHALVHRTVCHCSRVRMAESISVSALPDIARASENIEHLQTS